MCPRYNTVGSSSEAIKGDHDARCLRGITPCDKPSYEEELARDRHLLQCQEIRRPIPATPAEVSGEVPF